MVLWLIKIIILAILPIQSDIGKNGALELFHHFRECPANKNNPGGLPGAVDQGPPVIR